MHSLKHIITWLEFMVGLLLLLLFVCMFGLDLLYSAPVAFSNHGCQTLNSLPSFALAAGSAPLRSMRATFYVPQVWMRAALNWEFVFNHPSSRKLVPTFGRSVFKFAYCLCLTFRLLKCSLYGRAAPLDATSTGLLGRHVVLFLLRT